MNTELKLERHIAQTPEACFDLWARPAEVEQWWGPKDASGAAFKAKVEAWQAIPGEEWAITMTAPDGTRFAQVGTMLEVDRPHLLRFSFAWMENGRKGPETEIRVCSERRASARG